jgi:hypothetical protein
MTPGGGLAGLETAIPVGADPRRYARLLARVWEATLAGMPRPSDPRPVIDESWRRLRVRGVDPDHGTDAHPVGVDELERRRRESGFTAVLPTLRAGLVSVADQAAHIMVVVDADGTLLWREGSTAVRRKADGLGFVEGACWGEETVGTNAIGTALVVRRPLQVFSAEHYVRSHHAWTCAAAPVHDPRDGRLLGVVDLSGPAATVHPSTLALIDAVAQLAEAQLRTAHRMEIDLLRAVATPVLARIAGRAVAVDPHGWVAAATGVAPVDRILLPERAGAGAAWLPAFGACALEPLPGGWLIRVVETDAAPPTRVVLDLRQPRHPALTVTSASGTWQQQLSPRHAEMLFVLAAYPSGRSASQLAADLFGDARRTVTVRAEMSRLRRHLGGVLDHRPYRFADRIDVVVERPADPALLLPASAAPAVRALRGS